MPNAEKLKPINSNPPQPPLVPFLQDHLAQLEELGESTAGSLRDMIGRVENITEKFAGPVLVEGIASEARPVSEIKTVGDYIERLGKHVDGMDADARSGFTELSRVIQRLEGLIFDTSVVRAD